MAEVVGTVVSTIQHPVLQRERLLLLAPIDPDGRRNGALRIGIDRASASAGDRVLVVDEGNAGRQILDAPEAPVKTIIVGIVDYVEVANQVRYDYRDSGDKNANTSIEGGPRP